MQYKPGDRCWATGFELSRVPSRIIRNMPPTYVEFTCGFGTKETETQYRHQRWPANYVVPVKPDGKPNLTKPTGFSGLEFFDTQEAAAKRYIEMLKEEKTKIIETRKKLDAMEDVIDDKIHQTSKLIETE